MCSSIGEPRPDRRSVQDRDAVPASLDVFISHVEEDAGIAIRIADGLEQAGYTTWYYERDNPAGTQWTKRVARVVAASQAFLVVLSEDALCSDNVDREVQAAKGPYFPVLSKISHEDVGSRRPQWMFCFANATAVEIPRKGISSVVDRIVTGLEDCGVCPSGLPGPGVRPSESSSPVTPKLAGPFFNKPPFVGRHRERERLRNLTERMLQENHGAVVILSGQAGVGKKDLLNWYEDELAKELEVLVVRGSYDSRSVPLQGICQVVETLLDVDHVTRPQLPGMIRRKLKRLDRKPGKPGHVDDAEVELLSQIVDPRSGDISRNALAHEEWGLECLDRVLRRFARRKPLAIFLEDLHRADSQTIEFLDYLTGSLHVRPASLLVLGTVQTESIPVNPPLQEVLRDLSEFAGRYELLEVPHLDQEASEELIKSVFPDGVDQSAELFRCTGGHPLYLLLLLRHLYEKGWLQAGDATWKLSPDIDLSFAVPRELIYFVEHRIKALLADRPWVRTVLDYAAVAGETSPVALVKSALQHGEEEEAAQKLGSALDILEDADIVCTVRDGTGCWMRFTDSVYHRAIEKGLISCAGQWEAASAIHGAMVCAKTEFYANALDEHAIPMAWHCYIANLPEEAARYFLVAAWRAVDTFCYREAIRLYRLAATHQRLDFRKGVDKALAKLPEPADRRFLSQLTELLGWPMAVVCLEQASASPLWERVLPAVERALQTNGKVRRQIVSVARRLLAFLNYFAQTGKLSDLWTDLRHIAGVLIDLAEIEGDTFRKAKILDFLGYAGESLAPNDEPPTIGGECAGMAARCYLEAEGGVRLTPHAWRRSVEPAIWCYRRAAEYDKAIEWIRRYVDQIDFGPEEVHRMQDEIRAMAHQEVGTHLIHMSRNNLPQRDELLREAAQEFSSAGAIREQQYEKSRFSKWVLEAARRIKEEGNPDLEFPTDRFSASVLLIHNQYDALAADLVREQYEEAGQRCANSGPQDDRSLEELESKYATLVVFGSTAAPQLEKLTYLFRENRGVRTHHGVWQLNPYLSDREPFYDWWRRPKMTGKGEWILIGGTRRVDTILAAGAFARRFALPKEEPPTSSATPSLPR